MPVSKPNRTRTRETVLLLGGLPLDYLTKWHITTDPGIPARRLGLHFQTVGCDDVVRRYQRRRLNPDRQADRMAEELRNAAGPAPGWEPPPSQVQRAVSLYLVLRELAAERGATALNANCQALRRAGDLPLPCLALTLLLDEATPAACQGDLDALCTMILFRRLGAHPGYMGGLHIADGRALVSHCVLSRTLAAGRGVEPPFYFGDHHGRQPGPTLHTDVPTGTPVTAARFTRNLERLLLTAGTVVDSRDDPELCRNALVLEVPDLHALTAAVQGVQYHLVVTVGNRVDAATRWAKANGVTVDRI